MCKSDGAQKELQYLNDAWNLFLGKVYLQNQWQQFGTKNVLHLISFHKCQLKEIGHIQQRKTHDQEVRLGYQAVIKIF